jgi:Zn-dependent protease
VRGSWKIGRLWGIDVYIHWMFLLLLAWVADESGVQRGDYSHAASAVLFVLAQFLCVLLHEYGHAFAARRYGIGTVDITVTPLGGIARLEAMPTRPVEELVVAIAGPLVNVIIAVALVLGLYAGHKGFGNAVRLDTANIPISLLYANITLVGFNLIPAFPMDGGRILRAALAAVVPRSTATRIAALIGKIVAVGFVAVGLYPPINFVLAAIGVFVWTSGSREAAMVEAQAAIEEGPITDAMVREFHALSAGDTLGRAAALTAAGFRHDFPVIDGAGVLVGSLSQADLGAARVARGDFAVVAEVMHGGVPAMEDHATVRDALVAFRVTGSPMLAVYIGANLAGVVTHESLRRYLVARGVIREERRPPMMAGGFQA